MRLGERRAVFKVDREHDNRTNRSEGGGGLKEDVGDEIVDSANSGTDQ